MKREILCPECKKELRKLFPTDRPYPGEHVKFVEGKALNEYRCDQCDKEIHPDEPCFAFSSWADYGGIPYYEWESEFIQVQEEKKPWPIKIHLKGDYYERRVFLNGKELTPTKSFKYRQHSPDGFNWGYGGSGPAQLALAICLEILDNDIEAQNQYQNFKWKYIAKLPQSDFDQEIEAWL